MATVNAPTKRACDSCHRRKIKCVNGDASTCQSCATASLACTHNSVPQKKGPKGHRTKVLTELRNKQQNASLGFGALKELGSGGISFSHHVPDQLTPVLLEQCVDFFFANMYPLRPVLERRDVDEAIMIMSWSAEACCMVLALCACIMIHTDTTLRFGSLEPSEERHIGCVLLEESCRLWKAHDYHQSPTHQAVLVSWFYYICYLELGNPNMAWYHLREATTLARLLRMHNEKTYRLGPHDATQRRILFWSLFITERTHGIQFHCPVTLHATIDPPSLSEVQSDQLSTTGLACMVGLYTSIDGTFVDLWNGVQRHADSSWPYKMRMDLLEAVPEYIECTEGQAVEIRITQHWLRAVVWQLCSSRGLVGGLTDDFASRSCPIRIAKDLEDALGGFSQSAFETHGDSVVRQVFDIACCLIDAAAHQPFSQHANSPTVEKCVLRLLALTQSLRGGDSPYLSLLHTKLQEALPGALALWLSGPAEGFLKPPLGFC